MWIKPPITDTPHKSAHGKRLNFCVIRFLAKIEESNRKAQTQALDWWYNKKKFISNSNNFHLILLNWIGSEILVSRLPGCYVHDNDSMMAASIDFFSARFRRVSNCGGDGVPKVVETICFVWGIIGPVNVGRVWIILDSSYERKGSTFQPTMRRY